MSVPRSYDEVLEEIRKATIGQPQAQARPVERGRVRDGKTRDPDRPPPRGLTPPEGWGEQRGDVLGGRF